MMFWKKCDCSSKLSDAERADIWMAGFEAAMSKSWDMLVPVMAGNLEVLKKKIHDDATMEVIKRMAKK